MNRLPEVAATLALLHFRSVGKQYIQIQIHVTPCPSHPAVASCSYREIKREKQKTRKWISFRPATTRSTPYPPCCETSLKEEKQNKKQTMPRISDIDPEVQLPSRVPSS